MNTIATRRPAILMCDAVNTVTTELVRADIAPVYLTVQNMTAGYLAVSVQVDSRVDFDSAVHLFGLTTIWELRSDEPRIVGEGRFLDLKVTVSSPVADETIPADCDSASLS